MCVIVYKPINETFPTKDELKNCFINNPDGAGYMWADGEKVHIEKGFDTFKRFWKSLGKTRAKYGDNGAYVMHFRISTQAGTRPDCTHPFPLSDDMNELRKLSTTCKIGIAHNGIISLTSTYSYKSAVTHSDTMEFITDYLSLIIRSRDFYKDEKTLKLIEKLGKSRFAILDGKGHCQLLGSGWVEHNGCQYSNKSWEIKKVEKFDWTKWEKEQKAKGNTKTVALSSGGYLMDGTPDMGYWYTNWKDDDYYDTYSDDDWYAEYYNNETGEFDFDPLCCPATEDGDHSWCSECKHFEECYRDIGSYAG